MLVLELDGLVRFALEEDDLREDTAVVPGKETLVEERARNSDKGSSSATGVGSTTVLRLRLNVDAANTPKYRWIDLCDKRAWMWYLTSSGDALSPEAVHLLLLKMSLPWTWMPKKS